MNDEQLLEMIFADLKEDGREDFKKQKNKTPEERARESVERYAEWLRSEGFSVRVVPKGDQTYTLELYGDDDEQAEATMEERRTEMVRKAHERCFDKISEAQEYCEGYIDGLNKMFDACRDIMDGEAEGRR